MNIVVIGGMTLTIDVVNALCGLQAHPIGLVGYSARLSYRSNYQSLKVIAEENNIPLLETSDINRDQAAKFLSGLSIDWLIVAGWSQLLSRQVLGLAKKGAIGFHMSKLPQGRGRAPVPWTLIKNLPAAWVTLQWLGDGADTGDIALQESVPLCEFDDAETAVSKVNMLSVEMLQDAIRYMKKDALPRRRQDGSQATVWPRRRPGDGKIDWGLSVADLYNFIRALTTPFPGAFFVLSQREIKVKHCGYLCHPNMEPAGQVLGAYCAHSSGDKGMAVFAKDGILIFTILEDEQGDIIKGSRLVEFARQHKGELLQ
jgi:methionyl-tRNA formyltransferase